MLRSLGTTDLTSPLPASLGLMPALYLFRKRVWDSEGCLLAMYKVCVPFDPRVLTAHLVPGVQSHKTVGCEHYRDQLAPNAVARDVTVSEQG